MAFPRTQMRLRRDRLRIGLRPCATCHKFRLFTGFAAGRPPEHPPGRPLRYRIQAMGEKEITDCKKIHGHGLVRRGQPLTSQTAFGGQLPYKGSLVRPVARFHHSPSEYNGRLLRATSICHGTGYSHKSRRYALWDVPYGIAIRR